MNNEKYMNNQTNTISTSPTYEIISQINEKLEQLREKLGPVMLPVMLDVDEKNNEHKDPSTGLQTNLYDIDTKLGSILSSISI